MSAETTTAQILAAVREMETASSDLPSVSVRFLHNVTIESIEPFLKYSLFQSGFAPRISYGGFDNIVQELINPASVTRSGPPDVLVLSLHLPLLDPDFGKPGWSSASAIQKFDQIISLATEHVPGVIVVNTFALPAHYIKSPIAVSSSCDIRTEVARINLYVRESVQKSDFRLLLSDWETIAARVGDAEAFDARYWYLYKSPLKRAFLEEYAADITSVVRALKGKSKKCLVLDCDNTLWGGVVGEDGLDGIALEPNDYPGKAYYDFQKAVMQLQQRGVMVAICSKNNEQDVMQVFSEHPHCLLKPEHISATRINWTDKATGLSELAAELNIGLDAFVFVDDSDMECELIRQALPAVTVVQAPKNPFMLPTVLDIRLFDTLSVSDEDRKRTSMYQQEAKRKELAESFSGLEDYLRSLEMKAVIHPMTESEVPRVAQLTQKTNQFNLTTIRYSEAQIADLVAQPDSAVYSLTLRDRFGDMGLTGVLIARRDGTVGVIDTYLLSCRILGRTVEKLFVDWALTDLEQRWGVTAWQASYVKTLKNSQVERFWDGVGFRLTDQEGDQKQYRLESHQRIGYSENLIAIE